jgi:hypothetical protein
MNVFPIEIYQDILGHLRPSISTTNANEVDTKFMSDICNWWSPRPTLSDDEKRRVAKILDVEKHYLGAEQVSSRRIGDPRPRYFEILPLRQSV